MIVSVLSISLVAFANDVNWEYNDTTKTLRIYGSGDMDNYPNEYSMPWYSKIKNVESIVVDEGITSVGDYAFSGATRLKSVQIADSVIAVNNYAFSSCASLKNLRFGDNILAIADPSFAFNGINEKNDFVLSCEAGSYALNYAVKNKIPFDTNSVKCGNHTANIVVKGMTAYYPYEAKVSGTFKFYSTGNHDTYGYLYDSNMKLLKSNDDASSSNTNFSISYDLVKNETYYFACRIYNSTLLGHFPIVIEPVDYTVSGRILAMADKQGSASDIVVSEALIDGENTGGEFSYQISQPVTINIQAGNNLIEHTFSPDDDVQDIIVLMCDANNDGIVNGKDYVILSKNDSKYKELFNNFINYRR